MLKKFYILKLLMLINIACFAEIDLGSDTLICKGSCIKMSVVSDDPVSPFVKFEWSTGDSVSQITVCPEKTDTIWIKATKAIPDTVLTDTIIIYVNGSPPGSAPFKGAEVCEDSCITIHGPEGAQAYSWEPEEGLDDPHSRTPLACPEFLKNIYVVTSYTDTTINCPYKDTITLWVVECKDTTATEDTSENDSTFGSTVMTTFSNKLDIFPNPATDYLYLEIKENISHNVQVKIFGMDGQKTEHLFYSKVNGMPVQIDIHKYQPGLYYVYVGLNDKILIKKFLIN